MQIKVCGLTTKEDVDYCCLLGVNALGFILAESPRKVTLKRVEELVEGIPPFVATVAVVVNPTSNEVNKIVGSRFFSHIQFHGEEKNDLVKGLPVKTIKAISIAEEKDLELLDDYQDVDYLLFDNRSGKRRGGTGEQFNWNLLKTTEINKPYILAGGLGPTNIKSALQKLNMAGVDLNSGVEREPGIKDHQLLRDTVDIIRRMENQDNGRGR